jgi:hypothetical protein
MHLPRIVVIGSILGFAGCSGDVVDVGAGSSSEASGSDASHDGGEVTGDTPTTGAPTSVTGEASSSGTTADDPSSSGGADPCAGVDCPAGTACVDGVCEPDGDLCPTGASVGLMPVFGRDSAALMFAGEVVLVATALGLEVHAIATVEAAKGEVPAPLAWLSLPGGAVALAADGPLVAVAHGLYGVTLVDVGDPAAPIVVGEADTAGKASGVALVDGLLVVADRDAGLALFDVVDPAGPVLLATLPTTQEARDVAVVDGFAYVAAASGGLLVVDLADPAAPVLVASLTPFGEPIRVRSAGDRLYVSARWGGVRIFDLTVPGAPAELGAIENGNMFDAVDVAIDEATQLAYVAEFWAPMLVADVSDPVAPLELGAIDLPDSARGVAQQGARVWLAAGGHLAGDLAICDATDPANPQVLAVLGEEVPLGALDIREAGGVVHLAGGLAGLATVDPDAPGGPKLLATHPTEFPAIAVDALGGRAFLGLDRTVQFEPIGRFEVFDVADPAEPQLLGSLDVDGRPDSLRARDELVYVGSSDRGLLVIDVADPTSPTLVHTVQSSDWLVEIDIEGDLLAVARASAADLYSLADPLQPVLLSTTEGAWARSVALRGTIAYVSTYDGMQGALQILDIADPTAPVALPPLALGPGSHTLDVAGDGLWVMRHPSSGRTDLEMFDLADPLQPAKRFTRPVPGTDAQALHATAGRTFVADLGVPVSVFTPTCD